MEEPIKQHEPPIYQMECSPPPDPPVDSVARPLIQTLADQQGVDDMLTASKRSSPGLVTWVAANKGFAATAAAAVVLSILLAAVTQWASQRIHLERETALLARERAEKLTRVMNALQFAPRVQKRTADEKAQSSNQPAHQEPSTTPEVERIHQALMQSMRSAQVVSTPGEEHEFLESLEGTWDQTYRLWPDPSLATGAGDIPPLEGHGRGVNTMILGTMEPPRRVDGEEGKPPAQVMRDGRFLMMSSKGWYGLEDDASGQAEGATPVRFGVLRILGFDQLSGVYTANGFGLESTRGTSETGKRVSDNKVVLHGTLEGREATFVYRREIERKSDDEYTVTLIVTEVGGKKLDDFKRFELVNRRMTK